MLSSFWSFWVQAIVIGSMIVQVKLIAPGVFQPPTVDVRPMCQK